MYKLVKAGIKPWDINGGHIYKIDLTYILICQDLEQERDAKNFDIGSKGSWKKVSVTKD